MAQVRIDRRFCGPPDSGNGGYVAGLLARELGSSNVSVTLRLPPPLDRDLELGGDDANAWLKDGEDLIGTAERQDLDIDVPPPPKLASAREAEGRYAGFLRHAFPGCFVCGPARAPQDGMRIFPGATGDGSGQVAAVWEPVGSLVNGSGAVEPEFIWAALDCPGYWAIAQAAGIAVLGRFAVVLHRPVPADSLVVTGWPIASEGRKHDAGTAVHDSGGRLLAFAKATWITLRPTDPVQKRRM